MVARETWVDLDLPPDGLVHITTITVAATVTLRCHRSLRNTPGDIAGHR